MTVKTEYAERLMKKLQIGVGGRGALDEAHSIMAECYGTIGSLVQERALANNKAELLAEDIERLHLCLDDLGVPRADSTRKIYSMWGRVLNRDKSLFVENRDLRESVIVRGPNEKGETR